LRLNPSNAEVEGFIDAVGLRRTILRNLSNQIISIRNGEIGSMTNSSKLPITIRLDIIVPKSSRLARVRQVIRHSINHTFPTKTWSKHFRKAPSIYGMTHDDTHSVTIKVNAPLKYGVSWSNGYRIRELILTALQANHIAARVRLTKLIGKSMGEFKESIKSKKD
jgi:small-conductance mechanosensitive channel